VGAVGVGVGLKGNEEKEVEGEETRSFAMEAKGWKDADGVRRLMVRGGWEGAEGYRDLDSPDGESVHRAIQSANEIVKKEGRSKWTACCGELTSVPVRLSRRVFTRGLTSPRAPDGHARQAVGKRLPLRSPFLPVRPSALRRAIVGYGFPSSASTSRVGVPRKRGQRCSSARRRRRRRGGDGGRR
jgi:hypothetical protein